MFYKIKSHLKGNQGDTNVSKMTLVAIAFVVGAILLVMVTSAYKGPITNWLQHTVDGWFEKNTGAYSYNNSLGNDPFATAERLANGTIKGAKYRQYQEDGTYLEIDAPEALTNGNTLAAFVGYYADGSEILPGAGPITEYHDIEISEDGRTITMSGMTFKAYYPEG